jgi:hypothetical protein
MHDAGELTDLLRSAGFRKIDVEAETKSLRLPKPADFLWQYLHSTPLAEAAVRASEAKRDALERDVCTQWQEFVANGSMALEVGMTTAKALR